MLVRAARAAQLPALQDIEIAAGRSFRDVGMPEIAGDQPLPLDELAGYQQDGRALTTFGDPPPGGGAWPGPLATGVHAPGPVSRPRLSQHVGFIETVRTLDRVGSYPTAMQDLLAGFTEILVTDEIRDGAASLPGGVSTWHEQIATTRRRIACAPRRSSRPS